MRRDGTEVFLALVLYVKEGCEFPMGESGKNKKVEWEQCIRRWI